MLQPNIRIPSPTSSIQANNFIRTFRTIAEATALGLVLNDKDDCGAQLANLDGKIQSFNRFLLQQLSLVRRASDRLGVACK